MKWAAPSVHVAIAARRSPRVVQFVPAQRLVEMGVRFGGRTEQHMIGQGEPIRFRALVFRSSRSGTDAGHAHTRITRRGKVEVDERPVTEACGDPTQGS